MTAGKVFQTDVWVSNPETGESSWFHPGDKAPDWAVDAVDPNHFISREGDVPMSGPGERVDYSTMKKDELADLAAERGLDFEGTKADLVARLEESDAALG